MENTYTLGQFIFECENFEHSKEYHEMLKESMEIKLTENYIESCNFVKEHEEFLESFNGYFCEDGDKEVIDKLTQNIENKKESLFKRFIEWAKRLLIRVKNSIINLWNKIFNKNGKDELESISKLIKAEKNDLEKFVKVDKAIKASEEIIKKYKYVEGLQLTEIRDFGYDGFIKNASKKEFYYVMTLAFENKINVKRHIGGKEHVFLVTFDEYIDLFNDLLRIEDYQKFYKKYSNFVSDNGSIEFLFDMENIKKFSNELDVTLDIIRNIREGNKITKDFTDSEMEVVGLFSSMTSYLLRVLTEIGQCRQELRTVLRGSLTGISIPENKLHKPVVLNGNKKSELSDFDKMKV